MSQNDLIYKLYGNNKPDIIYLHILTIFKPYGKLLISNITSDYKYVVWIEDVYHGNKYVKLLNQSNISNILLQIKHSKSSDQLKKYTNKINIHLLKIIKLAVNSNLIIYIL